MTASAPSVAASGAPQTTPQQAASPASRRHAIGTLLVLVVTGVVIAAVAYLSNPQAGASISDATGNYTAVNVTGEAAGTAPVVGQPAPDFLAALTNGSSLRLSELRGKPVWLTFGASWCQPCRAENPDIQSTYSAYGDRINVVQVYMDEDAAAVQDYTNRVGISYLTVPDPAERLAAQYRILGIPSHFFIDSSGVLRQMKIGSMDPTTMKAALDNIAQ